MKTSNINVHVVLDCYLQTAIKLTAENTLFINPSTPFFDRKALMGFSKTDIDVLPHHSLLSTLKTIMPQYANSLFAIHHDSLTIYTYKVCKIRNSHVSSRENRSRKWNIGVALTPIGSDDLFVRELTDINKFTLLNFKPLDV